MLLSTAMGPAPLEPPPPADGTLARAEAILTREEGRGRPFDAGFRAAPGRDRSGFDIMPSVAVKVGDDVDRCRAEIKPRLALYVGGMGARGKNFYNELAQRYGYEAAARTIQELYLDGRKSEAEAAVPDALVDEVALCGPRERIRERLEEWKAAGVTTLMVGGDTLAVRTMAERGFTRSARAR